MAELEADGPWLTMSVPGNKPIRIDVRALDEIGVHDEDGGLVLTVGDLHVGIEVADRELAARLATALAPHVASAPTAEVAFVGADAVTTTSQYIKVGLVAFRMNEVGEYSAQGAYVPLTGGNVVQAPVLMLAVAVAVRDDAPGIDRAFAREALSTADNDDDFAEYAHRVLDVIEREHPHRIDHVVHDATDVRRWRELHPAFFGAFDWHSAVHAHWSLAAILREDPATSARERIEQQLDRTLTAANLATEAAYLAAHPTFERPYGWAWLLALAAELRGTRWEAPMRWAEHAVVAHFLAFLPKQPYPIRTGTHANTAFALGLALDYARAVGHAELEAMIVERAMTYFGNDRDAPARWEPGGDDFLSPSLVEADLMRRVVSDFPGWLHRFLPEIPPSLQTPATITDRSDGKLAHFDGLHVSREWCFAALIDALPTWDPLRAELYAAARAHARAYVAAYAASDYAGTHWLTTFFLYLAIKAPRLP